MRKEGVFSHSAMTPTRKGNGRLLRLKGGQGTKTRWYHWITSPRDCGAKRQGKVHICCNDHDGGVDLCGLLKDASGKPPTSSLGEELSASLACIIERETNLE